MSKILRIPSWLISPSLSWSPVRTRFTSVTISRMFNIPSSFKSPEISLFISSKFMFTPKADYLLYNNYSPSVNSVKCFCKDNPLIPIILLTA